MKLLGFQIANHEGENVQGDDGVDEFPSFTILSVKTAVDYLNRLNANRQDHAKYLLMPIYEGDIEEPSFA